MELSIYIIGFLIVSFGFVVFFGAPYVPTLKAQTKDILAIRKFKKTDVFVDIGSGDGVVLRVVAPHCKKATGYELSPWLVVVSKLLSRRQKNISIQWANMWRVNLPPDTTVVYTFLNGKYMTRMENKLQKHVNATGDSIDFVTYGFQIEGRIPQKTHGPMYLYRFTPLQT